MGETVAKDQAVLITAYNRPHKLRALIDSLRFSAPQLVFVHVDGPKVGDSADSALVRETQSTIKSLDWGAEVVTNFQEVNLGCRGGMHAALDWFFGHVDQGIILEDDLVVSPQALPWLNHGLAEFRRDDVWLISANKQSALRSYVRPSLTVIPHIWGWATWADRWNSHDKTLAFWKDYRESAGFPGVFRSARLASQLRADIDNAYHGVVDTWDLGFMADMWHHRGFVVSPPANLVSNSGFDEQATHTRGPGWEAGLPVYRIPQRALQRSPRISRIADFLELRMLRGARKTKLRLRALSLFLWNPLHSMFGLQPWAGPKTPL